MNIVQRIKDRCNEMHITISSLPVSFDTSIIYRWDKASPNTNKISEVADVLNVSVDWLLGKTDVKNAFEEFERLQVLKYAYNNINYSERSKDLRQEST